MPENTPDLPSSAEMVEYRRQHFDVDVVAANDDWLPGAIVLETTSNGHQWASMLFMPDEIDRVIAALQEAKRNPPSKKKKRKWVK